jgi:hypothetical protein
VSKIEREQDRKRKGGEEEGKGGAKLIMIPQLRRKAGKEGHERRESNLASINIGENFITLKTSPITLPTHDITHKQSSALLSTTI